MKVFLDVNGGTEKKQNRLLVLHDHRPSAYKVLFDGIPGHGVNYYGITLIRTPLLLIKREVL